MAGIRKQVIVVVHGVGIREAGVSTDLLSAGLAHDPHIVGQAADLSDWRPHSSDDFVLPEDKRYGHHGLRTTFPARLRRYRRYGDAARSEVTHERVIADFYWGDISGTGNNVLRVALGFVKVILGLSHAVRENAASVFPGKGARDVLMRRLAAFAALTIHGPIAAINVMLIAGLFLALGQAWGEVWVGANYPGAVWLLTLLSPAAMPFFIALPVALVAYALLRSEQVFLTRVFYGWLLISAVVVAGLGVIDLFPGTALARGLHWVDRTFASAGGAADCLAARDDAHVPNPARHGLRLFALMYLFWVPVFAVTLVLGVAERLARPAVFVKPFLMPALGLMILLWIVMIAAIWGAAGALTFSLVPDAAQVCGPNGKPEALHKLIDFALTGAIPAGIGLVVLLVVGVVLHLRKGRALRTLPPEAYLPQRDSLAERHRLIVSPWLMGVLVLYLLGTALFARLTLFQRLVGGGGSLDLGGWPGLVLVMLAVGGAIALIFARGAFSMGIAIFTDVLVYLNNSSWDCDERDGPRRTFVERALGLRRVVPDEARRSYWHRARIRERLRGLVDTLIKDEAPHELILVSHSQGTVISIDVLKAAGLRWKRGLSGKGAIKLVTMGSPYTHLYNTYFPASFPPPQSRPALRPVAVGGVLDNWVNIFRIDDFVGTHIAAQRFGDGGTAWPVERPVPPNGHTMYWVDEAVFAILRQELRFR